jgi:type VII secretion protein EccB
VASKRDQLQAHQFLVQRVISGLVVQQTDPEQPPFRRPAIAAFSSLALALVALTVVGVFGLIVPGGNKAFTDGKDVIVEKETGTRYVFVNGRLNPVTNYTSALLILGDHAATKQVSRNSLVGVPRGPRIGIPDAPEGLPDRKHLLHAPWTMCSQPIPDEAGTPVDQSVLLIGRQPPGGITTNDTAVLLNVPARHKQYLVWRGYRHEITDPRTVFAGLALSQESQVRAGTVLVDVLPAGPSVRPIGVAHAGRRSQALQSRANVRAGQLFFVQTSAGTRQFYLATIDRLVPINQFQYDIQIAAPQTRLAYGGATPKAIQLGPDEVAQAVAVAESSASGLPRDRPSFVQTRSSDAAVCAAFDAGAVVPRIITEPAMPAASQSLPTPGVSNGTPLADRVLVEPGWAGLVEVVPAGQAAAGTVSLVTDQGKMYPLASPDVLKILGYDGVKPIRMPAGLAARVPEGPALDPTAALKQPPGG